MAQLQVQANINSSLKQMLRFVSFSNFMLQESGKTEVQGLYRPPTWYIAQPEALPYLQKEIKRSDASEHIHNYKAWSEAPVSFYTKRLSFGEVAPSLQELQDLTPSVSQYQVTDWVFQGKGWEPLMNSIIILFLDMTQYARMATSLKCLFLPLW